MPTKYGHKESFHAKADQVLLILLENNKYFEKSGYQELQQMVGELFGVQERQASRYITAAKKEYRKIVRENVNKAFKQALVDRAYLINKYKKDDPKLALDAMKDREKLLDLYPVQSSKVEHKGEINQKIVFVENLDE
jgi:hypothetical protein